MNDYGVYNLRCSTKSASKNWSALFPLLIHESKFVKMVSVDNVKRTWVNYGGTREWSDPTQGQVGEGGERWRGGGEIYRREGGGMYSNWLVDNIAAEHLNTIKV